MLDIEFRGLIMPRQKVSRAIKETQEWRYGCVDTVIASTKAKDSVRRRSIDNKRRNYDLMNNKIDLSHFEYVTNPFNLKKDANNNFQLPATLQPYDVLYPIFNVLYGEESSRFFKPIVRVVNETAINEKEEQRKQAVIQHLQEFLKQSIQAEPGEEIPTPEEVLLKAQSSMKDLREIQASHLLSYYKRHKKLPDLFSVGFKDWLVAGEEYYDVNSHGGELNVRRVNPLQLWFTLGENQDQIDESPQLLEINYMNNHEIIDEFYDVLTPAQIDELEHLGNSFNGMSMFNPLMISEVESIYEFQNRDSQIDKKPVYRVRWKSFRKVGNFHYIDPQTGTEQVELVDESFKWNKKDPDQWVEWFWINEYWEGIRIGSNMYLDDMIRPRKHQFRSMDNLSKCKSGYFGNLCSAQNSQSTSLLDRLIPWVYLYFIIWFDTELALATNIGKIGLLDVSMIPDGWEPEKWMYYARAMRIGFVNSLNESNRKLGLSGQNMSTNNKELNLEMGNYIQFNITLLQEIERKIQNTAGVPPQRLGAITSKELVGNVERSITQSSLVTEELFRVHNGLKIRVCEGIIEVGKEILRNNKSKSLQYVTDNMDTILFTVDPELVNNADYGVFVSDAISDMETYAAFKEHIKFALQNDQMAFHQIADIYSSESVAEMKAELKKYHEGVQQAQAQQAQHEQQVENIRLQQEEEHFQQELQKDIYVTDANNQTKVVVAQISAFSRQDDLDVDQNGIPDPVEIGNQALKQYEIESKQMVERLKIQHEKLTKNKEQSLKEKEINSKESIEKEKLKVARENMKNDLQIAKTNARNRSKK